MCSSCNQSTCKEPGKCYEARFTFGLSNDKTTIVGSLDGVPFIPLPAKEMVQANETNTALKYSQKDKALVFENEKYKSNQGVANTVTVSEILSGADISQLGSVGQMIDGGLASIVVVDDQLRLAFEVPTPVQLNELSEGFIAYVPNPVSGSHYKIIKPAPGGSVDSLLVGHPDGSIEFAVPITSPIVVPLSSLTSNGEFSGLPATSVGDWGYQTMGTTQVVSNTYGSEVEVTLKFRYSFQNAATRSGVYCALVNGGSDYKTTFVEGVSNVKQEGYPGGYAEFSCILAPNQKCQFEFGGWADDDDGAWVLTIGSTNENGSGTPTEVAVPPVITVRRQI